MNYSMETPTRNFLKALTRIFDLFLNKNVDPLEKIKKDT